MITEKIYGNVWIYEVSLKTGKSKGKHSHEFDHLHQVVKGRAKVIVYNDDMSIKFETETKAGEYFRVPANMVHEIIALEEYLGNCIHALRDDKYEVVETDFISDINAGNIKFEVNKD
jgi:quercetin dioxygenase-like cupin family protein